MTTPEMRRIARMLIDPNPDNARKVYDDAGQIELGTSLKHGQRVPLIVFPKGDRFILVDGERRWRAADMAGLTELACIVLAKAPTKGELLLIQLAIDAHKAHLGPLERAALYADTMRENKLTAQQLHEREGISEATISKYLSIAKTSPEIQAALEAGTIGITDAYEMSKVPAEQQGELLRMKVAGVSRDRLAGHVRRQRSGSSPTVRVSRIICPLSTGATVTVSGENISLEDAIEASSLAQKAMKKALAEGLNSKTAQAVWRDKSKANGE